jgi:hypothetical protein
MWSGLACERVAGRGETSLAGVLARAFSEASAVILRLWRWLLEPTPPASRPRAATPTVGTDPRFFLREAVRSAAAGPASSGRELPHTYGRDRAALLARDPHWLFAFWEITPESRVSALRTLGAEGEGAAEVLRLYDTDDDGARLDAVADVELPPGADSWHLEAVRAGRAFAVEIGLRTGSGRFVSLVRSNVARTPPEGVSPDTSVEWAAVGPSGGKIGSAGHHWSGGRVEASGAVATSPGGSSDPPRR